MDGDEIAYGKGHDAAHDGYTLKYNPYKRFTSEWYEWKSGWNDENSDDPYWKNVKRLQRNSKKRKVNV